MEAKTDKANPDKAAPASTGAGETATTDAATDARQRLDEFTDSLQQTFDKAQQQLSATVARLREEVGKVDVEGARVRAASWIEENPTLAVGLAVGAGLLIGKALGSALTPEPPTLKKRALKQAKRVQKYAGELGEELAQRAAVAGGAIAAGGAAAAAAASRRAQHVGGVVAENAAEWGGRTVEYAENVLDDLQDTTKGARKQFKKKSKKVRRQAEHGLDFAGSLLDAARTAVAAVVVKKITDWTRKVA